MTIRRGDILWADLGMFPTTSVQGGVRPVIVVSNNKANTYSSVITVVPLTSRIYKKRYLPTHVFISKYDMTGIRKGSLALAEQVMSISTKCISFVVTYYDHRSYSTLNRSCRKHTEIRP